MNKVDKSTLLKISTRLGFKGAKSYATMYKGGTLNTFGYKDNSVSYFTIHLCKDKKSIVSIETNRTYFTPTKQIELINSKANYEKPLLLSDALLLLLPQKTN